jgi:hypothetical protein
VKTVDDTGTAVALRDGSRVVVRPARPDDRDLLLAGFERLRPESCDQRLAPMAELTDNIASLLIAPKAGIPSSCPANSATPTPPSPSASTPTCSTPPDTRAGRATRSTPRSAVSSPTTREAQHRAASTAATERPQSVSDRVALVNRDAGRLAESPLS